MGEKDKIFEQLETQLNVCGWLGEGVNVIDSSLLHVKRLKKLSKSGQFDQSMFESLEINALAEIALSLVTTLQTIKGTLKTARTTLEDLDDIVITRSDNNSQSDSDMPSYSAVFSKSPAQSANTSPSLKDIRSVVQSTLMEDERKRNLILFGVEENVSVELKSSVAEVLEEIDHKPVIVSASRLGQPGSKPRPVKVVCESSDTVHSILKASSRLKLSDQFSNVYITSDKSPEQRLERRKLVSELKDMRAKGSDNTRYYIKGWKVNSEPKPADSDQNSVSISHDSLSEAQPKEAPLPPLPPHALKKAAEKLRGLRSREIKGRPGDIERAEKELQALQDRLCR